MAGKRIKKMNPFVQAIFDRNGWSSFPQAARESNITEGMWRYFAYRWDVPAGEYMELLASQAGCPIEDAIIGLIRGLKADADEVAKAS